MSFAAFVSGVMQPTIDRSRAEQETKRRLEEHASKAKLDKALSEWEYYSPEERNAIAPELDKILKQKKGYSADLLGKGEQGYKFLKGALEQQKPIQQLESSAQQVAAKPISLPGTMSGPESVFDKGNIDLSRQPKVKNPDGSTSTVDSRSYNINGKEVLLPSVTPDGRHLQTDDEIVAEYDKTGRHLGAFNSVKEADEYAEQLHNDYAAGKHEPIVLPSRPVSLPPLPIEGSDIPRVDKNVLSLPPSQRALAAKDYRARQAGMLERQSKVGEIGTSPLGAEDKEVAIESLYLPPGVLSARERALMYGKNGVGGVNRDIGLGTMEFVSPDGKQRIVAQATRGRGFIDSRTGQPIDPDALQGWTKVYNQGLQAFPNQQGSIDVLNKTELQRRMNQGASIAGNVPDINPAETYTPVTSPTGQITGSMGTRSGNVRGVGGGPPPTVNGPMYKGALSDATQSTIAQLDNFQASIDLLTKPQPDTNQSLLEKHKDKIGFFRGNAEKGLAAFGGYNIPGTDIGGDPEVDSIITELESMKTSYTYLVSGKQINEAEQKRLAAVLPDLAQSPARLANNMRRFQRTIAIMRRVREMGREEGATLAELAAADREEQGLSPVAQQRRSTQAPAQSSQPKVGDHKEFPNGNIGVWDGKGWKKVNPPSQ